MDRFMFSEYSPEGLFWDSFPGLQPNPATTQTPTPPTDSSAPTISDNYGRIPIARLQVCSSCRRKKRKCSLERPSCYLCLKNGWTCEYRHVKKKPGPAKGSTGLKAQILEELVNGCRVSPTSESGIAIDLNEETKGKLIDSYFNHIQPSYPMFFRKSLIQSLAENDFPDKLLNAMFALVSKFVPSSEVPAFSGCPNPGERFAQRARQQFHDLDDTDAPISLNDVKAAVLLTLYEYTTFPGRRAWRMVATMVRMAVGMGLHRIDCGDQNSSLSDSELEEHRLVWWSVWKLDSAINTLASSPFGVDTSSIGTALPSTPIAEFTAGISGISTHEFLPPDSENPWKTARRITADDTKDDGMRMYLLAVCHLRTVSVCMQRLYSNPTSELIGNLMVLRNTLSCMRLSLPAWYFDPARQVASEPPDKHRLRLETLLIFHISHVQVFLPFSNATLQKLARTDSLEDWKTCVTTGQDIAAIFHSWNPSYFAKADPMLSSIVWFTYTTLRIHSMSTYGHSDEGANVGIINALDLLSLVLEHFAQIWPMSRLLLESSKNLQTWAWLRFDFPNVLSALAQLRIPMDPLKQDPAFIDIWNIIGRREAILEEIAVFRPQE